jgi:hypothetical protein
VAGGRAGDHMVCGGGGGSAACLPACCVCNALVASLHLPAQ